MVVGPLLIRLLRRCYEIATPFCHITSSMIYDVSLKIVLENIHRCHYWYCPFVCHKVATTCLRHVIWFILFSWMIIVIT